MSKSTVPVEHGLPNPAYDKVVYALDGVPLIRSLMAEVQAMAAAGKTHAQICQFMMGKESLRSFYDGFKAVPDTPPVLGPPPSSRELYGRFANNTKVLDVGSGNGAKLTRYTGVLRFTCVDPALNMPSGVAKQVRRDIAQMVASLSIDTVVSSFMSFCQLSQDVQAQLIKHDGLHLIPDHATLVRVGAADIVEDRVHVRTPMGVYKDQPMICAGQPIHSGYNMLATFAQRNIQFALPPIGREYKYVPHVQAAPVGFDQTNPHDISAKMDGVCFELETNRGIALLTDRSGVRYTGSSDTFEHMCLHVEELENCYTLIRVVAYRGILPPHSYVTLTNFVANVKIKINGKHLCLPPPYTGKLATVTHSDADGEYTYIEKCDGLITRMSHHDYYVKHQWTFDLRPEDVVKLDFKLNELGMQLYCEPVDGLNEYGANRQAHVVTLTLLRPRNDKTVSTKIDTAIYMLEQKTIPEIDSLN